MGDIVGAREVIEVEVRFEVRVVTGLAVKFHIILIGVENFDVTVFIDCLGILIESVRLDQIIVVGEDDIVTACHEDGIIGVLCNGTVLI